ncbi:CHAT domain-containing tetratricopeptide repeat protein [Bradyrhizobium sp. LHD-71]|uniref:CHAT domain-containing tetratricopeptide repeat protein n=1 Tax=Bradyrhizobium sp. LHD-71 TaxID=3072141 RepID=UPI00280DD060|nr:CHAT domain-containing tetratricopeptide repeat protein [Bradyrhizobium sp. LHD-71]MDQ8732184.1 CHAT domain-containing tetratricopeptide repeat protein [Bradyrhizobium sp. LHD-71]
MQPKHGSLLARVVIALLLLLCLARPGEAQRPADLPGLMQRITDLAKAGQFAEATSLARQLVSSAEKLAGKEHPLAATAQSTLAELLVLQGQLDAAEPVLKRVLRIREKKLGSEHVDVAATLASLANVSIQRSRYREADQYLQRTLSIRQRKFGPEHADTAMTLLSLGRVRYFEARHAEAEKLFQQALAGLRKALGPQHIQVAVALNNLAEVCKEQGRLTEAESQFREAVAIQERQFGPQSIYVSASLNNLGDLYLRQGKYSQAENLHRLVVEITQKALGPDHPDLAKSLNNLAITFSRQDRASEAEGLLKRALAIQEKAIGRDHPEVAATLNNLADAIGAQDRAGEAETLLRRSLAIRERQFDSEHASVAIALDNLAIVLERQGRFAEAEPIARRSLTIREKAYDGRHPLVARSLERLAVVLDDLRRHDEAEPLLRRALAIQEATLGDRHPDFAITLHNLASHYRDLGRWQDAHAAFTRASAILIERKGAGAGESRSGDFRSNADTFRGLIAAAYHAAENAPHAASAKLRADAFEKAQWVTGARTGAAVSRMSARLAAGGGKLGELVRERQDLAEQAVATDRAMIALLSQPMEQRGSAAQAELRERINGIARRMKDIDAALDVEFPDYVALTSAAPVSLDDAVGLLRANEALLLFVPTKDDIYLWAVTQGADRWVRIPLAATALDELVAALRCGLDRDGAWTGAGAQRCRNLLRSVGTANIETAKPFDLVRAHELYSALFSPVEDLVKNKHLFVVAAGPLTSIPLHVLVASPPAGKSVDDYRSVDWLARRAAISVLPSVASLKALRSLAQQRPAGQAFIGFGNPLLSGSDGNDRRAWTRQACQEGAPHEVSVASRAPASPAQRGRRANVEALRHQPPLPETADELCTAAQLLGAPLSAVRLGESATEREIKALSVTGELGRTRYLHFATHGLLASESEDVAQAAAEPALLLTPPQRASEEDDGLLTASEVAQLKLDADWVIMSACNTAAGDKLDTETLSGLARAFFYAGSRALLVSHWYVDSEATVKLVTNTFAAMSSRPGIGRAEALQRAMLTLIDQGGRMADPANWAPFVVVGEGGG